MKWPMRPWAVLVEDGEFVVIIENGVQNACPSPRIGALMTDGPDQAIPRIQTLLDTVRLLNSTLELKELTGIILEVVRAEIPVERITVFLVDRSHNVLRPLVAQDLDDEELSFPIGVGIAGVVAATGDILDIPNAYADPRFNNLFDRKLSFYTNDLLALPVSNRSGEIVAVLELLNRVRPITASDREFLLGISVYIGLALENSLLHAQAAHGSLRKEDLTPASPLTLHDGMPDPLTFAAGLVELIRDQRDLPQEAQTRLEFIRRHVEETTDAAKDFREFLEKQREGLTLVDLASELRRVSELQIDEWERNNIKTTLIVEAAPPIYAYTYELRLVLAFVIKSAEAAVLQSNENRKIRIHSWSTGRNVQVSLHLDHPISPELGMTRGLAVADWILQQCKAHIRFESSAEKGSTILLEFPVVHESIPE